VFTNQFWFLFGRFSAFMFRCLLMEYKIRWGLEFVLFSPPFIKKYSFSPGWIKVFTLPIRFHRGIKCIKVSGISRGINLAYCRHVGVGFFTWNTHKVGGSAEERCYFHNCHYQGVDTLSAKLCADASIVRLCLPPGGIIKRGAYMVDWNNSNVPADT